MNKLFYPKLALINIKKNGKFYFPYILTGIGTVMMFYIMSFIAVNKGMKNMPGAQITIQIMLLGCIIIGIFSAVFLFYTNSFLLKRRKKEFGLYNILGMEKRHIGKIMFFETVFMTVVSIAGGILCGILFSKLVILLFFKIVDIPSPIGFEISKGAVSTTLFLFIGIFLLILVSNLTRIHLANPIELLHGGNVGEREPKTKWLLAIIGFVCIGGGYFIALTTESPLEAISLFFLAVILVITGTYCLFTAGSIAILKILRRSKKFYYKIDHFTTISGMIYRMKQNAAGLANICILSTMVLVMVSGTASMYIGVDDALAFRYPYDLSLQKKYSPEEKFDAASMQKQVEEVIQKKGRKIKKLKAETKLSFLADRQDDTFILDTGNYIGSYNVDALSFYTADEYERLCGEKVNLKDNEVLATSDPVKLGETFELLGETYTVKGESSNLLIDDDYNGNLINCHNIIVANQEVLNKIYNGQKEAYGDMASRIQCQINVDIDGTDKEKISCAKALRGIGDYVECRQNNRAEFYVMYGGFLFLGVFLGILFLMAAVLIIYYKQISEGYEDKERFRIMQKVGMSRQEVRKSIRSQVLFVFFLPIIMAAVHVAAAFKIITKLLALLNLTNVPLFMACTIATILIFAVIYGIVYSLTARTYYKIVGSKED